MALLTAAKYFAIVFSAGFMLGMVRVPLLVPHLGERVAELIEMPFMIAVIYFSARYLVRRDASRLGEGSWALVGVIALLLLLAAEMGTVLALQSRNISEYFASRDPVSGSVYLISLALYALMPLILVRSQTRRSR